MKKITLFLLITLAAPLAFGQAFVQGKFIKNGYTNSFTVTPTSSVTAGDMLFLFGYGAGGAIHTTPTNTGTAGAQAWTACPTITTANCYYVIASSSGTVVSTVTFANTNNYDVGFMEFSGVNTIGVKGVASGTGTALSVTTSGSVSSASGCVFAIAGSAAGYVYNLTAGNISGVAASGSNNGFWAGNEWGCGTTYSGAITATATYSGSLSWYMDVITLYEGVVVSAPNILPITGTYNSVPSVTMAAGSDTSITYCVDSTNTCTPTTTYSAAFTPTPPASTFYVRAFGSISGVNSSITSNQYVLQVATPVPVYGASGAVNFTEATSGVSLYYNNTGGTATCSSTAYTGAVYANGTNAISVIGCLSGYTNSAAVSVQPDIPVASDNFTSYYNSALQDGSSGPINGIGNHYPYQLPMDVWETGSAWQIISSSQYAVAEPDPVLGGSNVVAVAASGNTIGGLAVTARTAEGYYSQQAASANTHTTEGAGVAVNCSSSQCYYLVEYGASLSGCGYDLCLMSATGGLIGNNSVVVTMVDGDLLELRHEPGCVFRPLLNGSPIGGGMAATYTIAGCATNGQPGFVVQSASGSIMLGRSGSYGGSIYNWQGYNIGGAASGYTPPTVAYTTYSNAMNGSTLSITNPPWFETYGQNSATQTAAQGWTGVLSSVALSGGYAGGVNGTGIQYEFREPFGVNQWNMVQWNQSSWSPNVDAVFIPLRHRAEQPGVKNGNCVAVSQPNAMCGDYVGYYPGWEPLNGYTTNAGSRAAACAVKAEYDCTPYAHITKITPVVSEADNNVVTVAGSTTAVAAGDYWLAQYKNGILSVLCAQTNTALPAWQASHTYTAGTVIETSAGVYQLATTSGTTGATQPAFSTVWNSSTNYGNTVTDGGVTWMYYGDACPTTYPHFTEIIHAPDSDLLTGYGVPGLFEDNFNYASSGALPMFTNWSAGTIGYGTGYPCTTSGMSCTYISSGEPQPMFMQ